MTSVNHFLATVNKFPFIMVAEYSKLSGNGILIPER